jgi:hypothetical protein
MFDKSPDEMRQDLSQVFGHDVNDMTDEEIIDEHNELSQDSINHDNETMDEIDAEFDQRFDDFN